MAKAAASDDSTLKDIREAYEYDKNGWDEIRKEAGVDMRYVSGKPFDEADLKQREGRPTIAPDELSQYRNQVTNGLMAIPRGMKFSPRGAGASQKGAEFYQNKAREIEYRSHAVQHYILAADNALQRGYGFVRVRTDYVSPRSANQELFIDGFPNPNMVLPAWDALRPDSADMQRCTVHKWLRQAEFTKQFPRAKIRDFTDYGPVARSWIKGSKILLAEHWTIKTRPRSLWLVDGVGPQSMQFFEDEIEALKARIPTARPTRALRTVDYPDVWMYLTNGVELLHAQQWLGKYIPIVSCYGKVLYLDNDEGLKREILSMTRFMRDPWKAYCYACSQELEILNMVPRTPLMMAEGQMDAKQLEAVARSMHEPVAALTYKAKTTATGEAILPPPVPNNYVQAQYLQAIEIVKEGFRRAIQAAAGSNFLPTQAQGINDKSGVALEKINEAATMGTRHFVNSYEDLIRQTGVIVEDLLDKIHDYSGQTDVILPDGKSQTIHINTPSNPEAITTAGEYLCTVSTAPSSDSEYDAVAEFLDTLIAKIDMIAAVAGPKPAAAMLAMAIRMRNLGAMGGQIADVIEPPEYKAQEDGKPPDPRLLAAQSQIQQLTQQLKQAGVVIQTKQIEGQTKLQIEREKTQATSADKDKDREVKLVVAELGAKIDRMALLLEASERIGVRLDGSRERQHDAHQQISEHRHEAVENAKDRAQAHVQSALEHERALELADRGVAGQLAVQDNAPQPTNGAA